MNHLMFNKNYIDLVEEAMLRLGESAPDTVEQVLQLPHMKLFTGALKAYESDGARVFRATASSTIEDLHGDTMTEDCVRDMARQAKSGPIGKGLTIFLNHSYKVPEDVAGKVVASQVLNRANDESGLPIWDMDYEIRLATGSGRIDQTWNLIKNDEITLGISIGAYILEYDYKDKEAGFWGGLIINKVLLVETSIVGIPANQRSWVQNAVISIGKSLGFEEKQIRRVLDGKEARPMTMKIAAGDGIVKTPIEAPADGTMIVLESDNENRVAPGQSSPVAPGGEPTASADTTPTVTNDAEVPEAEASEDAEAAPSSESPAEQTTESDPETDGEITEEASPALADVAPEVALSLETGSTPAVELVLAALEAAAKQVTALRAEKATLVEQVKVLTEERDKAIKDVNDAADIIEIVAKSPLGRKTQFAQPVGNFQTRFAHIYDARFLKLMDETEND